MKNSIVGLKDLREHMEKYISEVRKGRSFVIVRRSKPLFKISAVEEDNSAWETAVDLTKVKRGGVLISGLLKRL